MAKEGDFSEISYTLGILSVVLAFTFQPLAAFVIGIIGFLQSKKQKTNLSKRARNLSTIGIISSIVIYILALVLTAYFAKNLSPLI